MTAADRIVDRLRAAPARQRAALLMEYLRGQIADRLLVEPSAVEPRGQLMALGMTSLQAVELKIELETQLAIQLRSSLLFDYPTLEALVPFILERLDLSLDASRPARAAARPAPRLPVPLAPAPAIPADDASADGLAAALAAELADLHRG
jgi:acyl carrier protein